jgi:hypothetical protein
MIQVRNLNVLYGKKKEIIDVVVSVSIRIKGRDVCSLKFNSKNAKRSINKSDRRKFAHPLGFLV